MCCQKEVIKKTISTKTPQHPNKWHGFGKQVQQNKLLDIIVLFPITLVFNMCTVLISSVVYDILQLYNNIWEKHMNSFPIRVNYWLENMWTSS